MRQLFIRRNGVESGAIIEDQRGTKYTAYAAIDYESHREYVVLHSLADDRFYGDSRYSRDKLDRVARDVAACCLPS